MLIVDLIIIKTASPSTIRHTAAPVVPVIICRKDSEFSLPNCISIAVSSESIDTSAAARLITLAADIIGLLYFLYLITLITAVIVV